MSAFEPDSRADNFTEENGLFIYEFPNLSAFPEIRHAVFTRKGGASPPPFSSLNVSLDVDDSARLVEKNRKKISAHFNRDDLVFARQVHGPDVLVFMQPGRGCTDPAGDMFEGDAMVTDIPGKMLAIKAADCQSVLLFDPIQKVVGNIHSGWRGSLQNIIGCTLRRMETDFGCHPSDIIAGIGPSLGPCCAEFIHFKKEIPEKYWAYKDDRDYFDFWAISLDQLCSAGVSAENIHCSRICTSCRTDLFFSYRKEGTTGRFASVIGLRDL